MRMKKILISTERNLATIYLVLLSFLPCVAWGENVVKDGIVYELVEDGHAVVIGTESKDIVNAVVKSEVDGHPVTNIATKAFDMCDKMATLVIPASVNNIENQSFDGCISLQTLCIEDGKEILTVGYSVYNSESYGKGLFRNCPLKKLYLGRDLSYKSYSEYDSQWGFSPFAYTPLEEIEVGPLVTFIQRQCFRCTQLTHVNLPQSVTSIGEMAFFGCDKLTDVQLPNTLKSIRGWAFYGCGFSSFTIPDGVTYIGASAFHDCTKLQEINIPPSVEDLGDGGIGYYAGDTFLNCRMLHTVRFEKGDEPLYYCNHESELFYAENVYVGRNIVLTKGTSNPRSHKTGSESLFSRVKQVEIADNVTELYDKMFYNCDSLRSLPKGRYSTIGYSAFYGCDSLAVFTIPSTVTSIKEDAFRYSGVERVYFEGNESPVIGKSAFYGKLKNWMIGYISAVVPKGAYESYIKQNSLTQDVTVIEEGCAHAQLVNLLDEAILFTKENEAPLRTIEKEAEALHNSIMSAQTILDNEIQNELTLINVIAQLNTEYAEIKTTVDALKKKNEPILNELTTLYAKAKTIAPDYETAINCYHPYDGIVTNAIQFAPDDNGADNTQLKYLIDADTTTNCVISGMEGRRPRIQVKLGDKGEGSQVAIRLSKTVGHDSYPDSLHFYGAYDFEGSQVDLGAQKCVYSLDDGNTALLLVHVGNYPVLRIEAGSPDSNVSFSELHVYSRICKADCYDSEQFYKAFLAAKNEIADRWATSATLSDIRYVCSDYNIEKATNNFAKLKILDFTNSCYLPYYTDKMVSRLDAIKIGKIIKNDNCLRCEYIDTYAHYFPYKQAVMLKGGYGNMFGTNQRDYDYEEDIFCHYYNLDDNRLSSTLKNESVNCEYENYYKFNYADTEREDGFYLVENKQSSFISMAGDLYIKLDKYDAANTIAGYTMQQLETGISTGIATNTIQNNSALKVYRLDGRCVDARNVKQLPRGIYIINGKKVLIK